MKPTKQTAWEAKLDQDVKAEFDRLKKHIQLLERGETRKLGEIQHAIEKLEKRCAAIEARLAAGV
ncbi:hypothetical protein ASE05_01245 [Mesorhizobium sp. Root172]|nr:hypothetical protein ASE05_01245 [Mesorhizobium sp. Root172]